MAGFDKEMQKALEADGEKLRQLTGEDHGPYFDFDDDGEECWNCSGEGYYSSCFEEFACVDPDSGCDGCTRTCEVCKGKGVL